jgi:trehalose/maltose hydrolase-like predicted phosphorylase
MIRYNYHKAHSDTEWGKKETYDLLINTDMFVRDHSAVILASAMKEL